MATANDFSEWLQKEIDSRNWKQADLVRRSGINGGLLSQVLSNQRNPGIDFCKKIAHAFGMSEIDVLRHAGLTSDPPKFSPIVEATASMLNDLPEDDQEDIRAMVRSRWERRQRKKPQHAEGRA